MSVLLIAIILENEETPIVKRKLCPGTVTLRTKTLSSKSKLEITKIINTHKLIECVHVAISQMVYTQQP